MSTLRFFLAAVLVALALCAYTAAADSTPLCSLPSNARQPLASSSQPTPLGTSSTYWRYAQTAYTDYYTSMYDPVNNQLRSQINSTTPAAYWNTAIALHTLLQHHNLDAAYSMVDDVVPLVRSLLDHQTRFSEENDAQLATPSNGDMVYMIHTLTALYDATLDTSFIDTASVLFDKVQQSDDDTCCGAYPGGLWSDNEHTVKSTAGQAGVALAALRVLESDASSYKGQAYWLEYAVGHYSYWRDYMVDNNTGHVYDHIDASGRPTRSTTTQNLGLMIGTAAHLYTATNDTTYLNDARLFASYLLAGQQATIGSTQAMILVDDASGGCSDASSQFHQVSYQYLTEYYQLLLDVMANQLGHDTTWVVDAQCDVYTFLQANVDSLWVNARHIDGGGSYVYDCNWSGADDVTVGLQGSMNSALSALTLFAGLPVPMVVTDEPSPPSFSSAPSSDTSSMPVPTAAPTVPTDPSSLPDPDPSSSAAASPVSSESAGDASQSSAPSPADPSSTASDNTASSDSSSSSGSSDTSSGTNNDISSSSGAGKQEPVALSSSAGQLMAQTSGASSVFAPSTASVLVMFIAALMLLF